MASLGCLSSLPALRPPPPRRLGSGRVRCSCAMVCRSSSRRKSFAVCMAPEEEKITRRSRLDFPIGCGIIFACGRSFHARGFEAKHCRTHLYTMDAEKPQAQPPLKTKVNKKWNAKEDDVLVEALYELASSSYWKADNGFRAGYLSELEKMMAAKISNCDIRSSPHIESRVKTLKKQTNAITEMIVVSSGFITFDETEKCIKCEKQLFDDWVKSHPQAAGLRNRPFKHYDTLCEVFGHDRASGGRAETLMDSIIDIDNTPETLIDDDIAAQILRQVANEDEFLADMDANMDFNTSSQSSSRQPSPPEDNTPTNHTTPGNKAELGKKGTCHRKRSRSSEGTSDSLRDIASSFKDFVDISREHIVNIKENREDAKTFQNSLTTILERDHQLKERDHEVRQREQMIREREIHIREMQETPS